MTECIHDLEPATCSICNGRDRRDRTIVGPRPHSITSRFDSRCDFCDRRIREGDAISPSEDGTWIHSNHWGDDR
jgi:hypothetical protein